MVLQYSKNILRFVLLATLTISVMVFCPSAQAGLGFADSGPAVLDTRHPVLELDHVPDNLIINAGNHLVFHWTSYDDNPGTDPDHFQAAVIIDAIPDSSLSWYPDIEDFTWDWIAPEVQTSMCRLEVSVSDVMGNTTHQVSNYFSVFYSTTGTPDLPENLRLSAPVPNPFNPSCRLEFSLPWTGQTTCTVHDLRGRRVRVLDSGLKQAGSHTLRWDGTDDRGRPQPGGLYFFVMEVQTPQGQQRLTQRAVLIP